VATTGATVVPNTPTSTPTLVAGGPGGLPPWAIVAGLATVVVGMAGLFSAVRRRRRN
jgi:hypothetical protein